MPCDILCASFILCLAVIAIGVYDSHMVLHPSSGQHDEGSCENAAVKRQAFAAVFHLS